MRISKHNDDRGLLPLPLYSNLFPLAYIRIEPWLIHSKVRENEGENALALYFPDSIRALLENQMKMQIRPTSTFLPRAPSLKSSQSFVQLAWYLA